MTCLPLSKRWKNGQGYNTMLFGRAIKKYGWENIKHEVIAEGLDQKCAEALEMTLIRAYKANNPAFGYNVDNGGHSADSISEQTRKKQRLSHLGKTPWNKGLLQTEATKTKIREAFSPRAVFCIELSITYPSVQNAAKTLSIPSANILQACNGKRKTAGQLHWRYKDED